MLNLQVTDRLNWFQKCCLMYNFLKKDLSNAIVHYEEAQKYFPREFKELDENDQVKNNGKLHKHMALNADNESYNFANDTMMSQ